MYSSPNKRSHDDDVEVNEIIRPKKQQKMVLYLDDSYTPVRTIEVSNIEVNTSAEYLRGYFEFAAGGAQVSDVTFAGRIVEGKQICVAYVTYVLPEDAAMLLLDRNLKLKFTVKPADASYQFDRSVTNLVDINDDCLLHIALHLSPIDLVNLSRTCQRLESIVTQMYQKKTHLSGVGNVIPSVTEEDLPIVLQAMGPFIKSVDWKLITSVELAYLTEYCSNVITLKLQSPSLVSFDVQLNKIFFKHIQSLVLVDCPSIYDNSMKTIVNSSKLKSLWLTNCRSMQGKFISHWKNRQLRRLNVRNSPAVRNFILDECATGQLNSLVLLTLDCNKLGADKIEVFRSLRQLRYLTLTNVGDQMAGRVYSSIHNYLPEMVTFKMFRRNKEVNSKPISDMVDSLAKLTKFSHSPMSWESLHMIRQVRELGKKPPIEILISREMFDDPVKMEFVAASHCPIKLALL